MRLFDRLRGGPTETGDEVFDGMRAQALSVRASDVGAESAETSAIHGVLMETGFAEGTATFVCLGDGTVSLYTSSGGGVIGAGQHDDVRAACRDLIAWSNQYGEELLAAAEPVDRFPLPRRGWVHFYLLSGRGVSLRRCSEERLVSKQDPFSNLFAACHAVLAEARQATEKGADER